MEIELASVQSFSEKLFNAVELAKDDCSNEHLHELRLKLKTVKTFCVLCENVHPDHHRSKELFSPFKKLFKHAGRLRDNYQLEKKLKHYFTEDEKWIEQLKHSLHSKRHALEEKFINRAKKFAADDAEAVLVKVAFCLNSDRAEQVKSFRLFSTEKMAVVEKMMFEGCDNTQLHFIRSQLKQIFLLHKFLRIRIDKKKIIPQIDHLQEELGTLHDSELLYEFADKNLNDNAIGENGLQKRLHALETMIEKLRIDCLKKLSLLVNISHF